MQQFIIQWRHVHLGPVTQPAHLGHGIADILIGAAGQAEGCQVYDGLLTHAQAVEPGFPVGSERIRQDRDKGR